jgi:glycosyltransferase involved in cell wall biosynthesis
MDIINLSEAQAEWNWLHGRVTGPEPLRWRHASTREVTIPGGLPTPQSWRRLVAANRAATMLSEPSAMLVSHGPRMTMYGSFAMTARLRSRQHLAYAFNFTTLAMAASTRRVMRSAFGRVDRFVVFSTMERRLYAEFFDLDIARFDMLHWSVNRPVADPARDPSLPDAYLCAIGSQGRDYGTLMAAMALLPRIRLVVVVTPESLRGLSIPPNVTVRFNVPLPQTMAILQQSRFSVVPLLGTEVPCGHVTLVSAMHLGKASIVSDSTGIADYVQDHANGLTVPPSDPVALARAIEQLWNDTALTARLADRAHSFALRNCSEQSAVDYLEARLRLASA